MLVNLTDVIFDSQELPSCKGHTMSWLRPRGTVNMQAEKGVKGKQDCAKTKSWTALEEQKIAHEPPSHHREGENHVSCCKLLRGRAR